MAKATTGKFSELVILLGDGATPEVFASPCGLTSKGIQRSATTQSTSVPDCADEDAPAWEEKAVDTLSMSVSGSGVMSVEARNSWLAWYRSGLAKNIRVGNTSVATGDIQYEEGPAVLTTFNETADRGQKINVEIAIEFDGQPATTVKP